MTKERRYTAEQLSDANKMAKMLASIPEEKRSLVIMMTNSFMAGMEAQRAIDTKEPAMASARQGAIEDEMTYQEEEEAILAILDEIYETFVISCYLTGLIKVNKDFWTKKGDYLEHGWIKSPKKWIDPLKESSANKTALNTGQKTYKEIAAENGRDWKQQIDDNLEVIEYAKKKGYDLGGVIFDGKLGSEKEEPKPEPPKPDDQTGDGQEEGTNDDDKGTQSGDGKEGQSASDEGQE